MVENGSRWRRSWTGDRLTSANWTRQPVDFRSSKCSSTGRWSVRWRCAGRSCIVNSSFSKVDQRNQTWTRKSRVVILWVDRTLFRGSTSCERPSPPSPASCTVLRLLSSTTSSSVDKRIRSRSVWPDDAQFQFKCFKLHFLLLFTLADVRLSKRRCTRLKAMSIHTTGKRTRPSRRRLLPNRKSRFSACSTSWWKSGPYSIGHILTNKRE